MRNERRIGVRSDYRVMATPDLSPRLQRPFAQLRTTTAVALLIYAVTFLLGACEKAPVHIGRNALAIRAAR